MSDDLFAAAPARLLSKLDQEKRLCWLRRMERGPSLKTASRISGVGRYRILTALRDNELHERESNATYKRLDWLEFAEWLYCTRNGTISLGGSTDEMTSSEATAFLGISRNRLYKLIARGFPSRRQIGKSFFSKAAIYDWLIKNKPYCNIRNRRCGGSQTKTESKPGIIYGLCDPRTKEVRYIGKTVNGRTRYRQHLAEARKDTHSNIHLQRLLAKWERENIKPEFRVLQECLPYTLDTCERHWIEHGRKMGWRLVNIAGGGEGCSWTDEARRRQSELCRDKNRALAKDPKWIDAHERGQASRMKMTIEQYREQRAFEDRRRPQAIQNALLRKYQMIVNRVRKSRSRWVAGKTLRIDGLVAYVPLTKGQEAVIDADDVDRVSKHLWAAQHHRESYRAKRSLAGGGIELLSWFIMGKQPGQMVTYRNGNTLDCRKSNLRVIEQASGKPQQIAA